MVFFVFFSQQWGFKNADVIYATSTKTLPVVYRKEDGLYYYSSATKNWFPIEWEDAKTSVSALAGGSDVVLASSGTKVAYLRHVGDPDLDDEGKIPFFVSKKQWDFGEIAPGATKIAAIRVSEENVSILVEVLQPEEEDKQEDEDDGGEDNEQDDDEDNDVKIGATRNLEAAMDAEES